MRRHRRQVLCPNIVLTLMVNHGRNSRQGDVSEAAVFPCCQETLCCSGHQGYSRYESVKYFYVTGNVTSVGEHEELIHELLCLSFNLPEANMALKPREDLT